MFPHSQHQEIELKDYFQDKTKGVNDYIQKYRITKKSKKVERKDANVIVLASGNLGLVYLTDHINRLTYEEMNQLYSDLIPGLAKHRE